MSLIHWMIAALAAAGTVYYLLSTLALAFHFGSKRPDRPEGSEYPRVSILKPVCGYDAEARSNFESFLLQDYPDYEVLFGALDPADPALAVAGELVKGSKVGSIYPGSDFSGENNKCRILARLLLESSGEIMLISDSDTRIKPSALKRVVAPFSDPEVGMVTCAYRGVHASTVGDVLQSLHMTCVFQPGVACARVLGLPFGLGALIAIRRSVLEEIGGFQSIIDYLADDFLLAQKTAQTGRRIVLSDYVIDIVMGGESISCVLSRELRWSQTVRLSNPPGHLGLMITFGLPFAIINWISSGFSQASLALLGVVMAIRLATAYIGASVCLRDRETLRHMYLLPLRDLVSLCVWMLSFMRRSVRWRGNRYLLVRGGKMVKIV